MNSLPSASQRCALSPRSINNGVPNTDLKARTGEFTPPGKYCFAFSNNSADFALEISGACIVIIFECEVIFFCQDKSHGNVRNQEFSDIPYLKVGVSSFFRNSIFCLLINKVISFVEFI
ncbi:hypothetical protein D3C80_1223970 [compost metagenome]